METNKSSIDRNVFMTQLQDACDLEDKFILEFDSFFKQHVSDNYHLSDTEKEFVDTRIKILLVDSKRHLELFKSIIEEVRREETILL